MCVYVSFGVALTTFSADDTLNYVSAAAATVLLLRRTSHIRLYRTLAGVTIFSLALGFGGIFVERHPGLWDVVGPVWRHIRLGTLLGYYDSKSDPFLKAREQKKLENLQ